METNLGTNETLSETVDTTFPKPNDTVAYTEMTVNNNITLNKLKYSDIDLAYDGKETISLNFTCSGSLALSYFDQAILHTRIDGTWYDIPGVSKQSPYVKTKRIFVKNGESANVEVYFPSSLSDGRYRVIFCGITFEFDFIAGEIKNVFESNFYDIKLRRSDEHKRLEDQVKEDIIKQNSVDGLGDIFEAADFIGFYFNSDYHQTLLDGNSIEYIGIALYKSYKVENGELITINESSCHVQLDYKVQNGEFVLCDYKESDKITSEDIEKKITVLKRAEAELYARAMMYFEIDKELLIESILEELFESIAIDEDPMVIFEFVGLRDEVAELYSYGELTVNYVKRQLENGCDERRIVVYEKVLEDLRVE